MFASVSLRLASIYASALTLLFAPLSVKSYVRLSPTLDARYVTPFDGDDSRTSTCSSYTLVLPANMQRQSFP
jgi:hypothetical protein